MAKSKNLPETRNLRDEKGPCSRLGEVDERYLAKVASAVVGYVSRESKRNQDFLNPWNWKCLDVFFRVASPSAPYGHSYLVGKQK